MSMLNGSPATAPLPRIGSEALIARIEAANLQGRGGAGFPVAKKWRTVRENGGGRAVMVANGAEGEPLSGKDRTLMARQPQLVIDGALHAARFVGAQEIVFYVGSEHRAALSAMRRALGERREHEVQRARLVEAPTGYVCGEESAVVHYLNDGDARPTVTPPRPFERGVGGRPTLVQNVESLAWAALIARGEAIPGALVTASGSVRRPGVYELPMDATPADVADAAGGLSSDTGAVLIGGYFGRWASLQEVWPLTLQPSSLRARGLTFGCGVLHFLPADSCPVHATAGIMKYLAGQSARQCGPCVFGLEAIAGATSRLAQRSPQVEDLLRIERWSGELNGRGACKHPDGAAGLLQSALQVFADDFEAHQHRRCVLRPSIKHDQRVAEPVEAVA